MKNSKTLSHISPVGLVVILLFVSGCNVQRTPSKSEVLKAYEAARAQALDTDAKSLYERDLRVAQQRLLEKSVELLKDTEYNDFAEGSAATITEFESLQAKVSALETELRGYKTLLAEKRIELDEVSQEVQEAVIPYHPTFASTDRDYAHLAELYREIRSSDPDGHRDKKVSYLAEKIRLIKSGADLILRENNLSYAPPEDFADVGMELPFLNYDPRVYRDRIYLGPESSTQLASSPAVE